MTNIVSQSQQHVCRWHLDNKNCRRSKQLSC